MKNRKPHTYARRTITLRPELDKTLVALALRDHRGNISAAVSALVTKYETDSPTRTT